MINKPALPIDLLSGKTVTIDTADNAATAANKDKATDGQGYNTNVDEVYKEISSTATYTQFTFDLGAHYNFAFGFAIGLKITDGSKTISVYVETSDVSNFSTIRSSEIIAQTQATSESKKERGIPYLRGRYIRIRCAATASASLTAYAKLYEAKALLISG